jgi:methionyl-tRNA formyltransferase
MDVVFLGSGRFAQPILEKLLGSKHKVIAVVTQPDRPRARGRRTGPTPLKIFAESKGCHLYQPEEINDPTFLREMRALSPSMMVMAAYGQRLSPELLSLPRYAVLNIHASLLPRHRGPAPIARAILIGDTTSGVTVLKTVARMDAGPTYAQRSVEIGPDETAPQLEARLAPIAADLTAETLDAFETGSANETPQDEKKVTFARKFMKEEGRIQWRRPAARIHNMVRALQPFPLAFSFLDRMRVGFLAVRPEPVGGQPPARPGTIAAVDEASFRIACGEGEVTVLELQPEGGRRMATRDFLNGHPLKVGNGFR